MRFLLACVDVYEGQEMPQDLPYPGVIFREPIEDDEGPNYYNPLRGLRMWYLSEVDG